MKAPENMDSTDLFPDSGPSDEEVRRSVAEWLDENDIDFGDFFEGYIDPEGPLKWSGGGDARDAIYGLLAKDPHMVAEALREYVRESY